MKPLPQWLEPMAASLSRERVVGGGWRFERKHDGIRLLAYRANDRVRLYSRNRIAQNIPAVADAIRRLPGSQLILDGEITGTAPHTYHVFDLPWRDGRPLTEWPLSDRIAELEKLTLRPPLARVPAETVADPWAHACAHGWEGVVAKQLDSPYEHRRSRRWLKLKCERAQEFVVGGFTEPRGSRVGFGALLIGYFEGDELRFAGKIGTGFDSRMLRGLRAQLDGLLVAEPPFIGATGLPRSAVRWVRPRVVVQAAFLEWTGHGKLRHPRMLGLRDEKDAHDVVRESGPRHPT